jgi:PAS domain S-box-containing protein
VITPLYIRDKQEISNFLVQIQDITERKLTEQKLKEYSRNLEDIVEKRTEDIRKEMEKAKMYLDISASIILVLNSDGLIELINKKGCEILGYDEEQLIGKNCFDNFIPKENKEEIKSLFRKSMAGEMEPVECYENLILTREGKEKLIAWHNTVLKDEQGNIIGILSSGEDITERRKMMEELRIKDIVFNASLSAQSTADINGIINLVNPAFLKLWGYKSNEEAIGNSVGSFFANPDDAVPVLEALTETGKWEGKFLAKRNNGSTFISQGFASAIFNENGDPVGFQSANLDVTKRKQAEEEIAKLARFPSENPNPVLRLTKEKVIYTNKGGEILFNIKEGSEVPAVLQENLIKALVTNKAISTEITLKRLIYSLDFTPVSEEGYVNVYGRDITERKKAEMELQLERDNLINILNSMEDGVYIVDQNYDIEYVNPSLTKEFGQYEGKKCYKYLHSRQDVCPWCKAQEGFEGKTVRLEWYSFKNQKTYDRINMPLKNVDGSVSTLEIFRDITEFKKVEQDLLSTLENLKSVNIELERFAYVASHDLQEPLRMIVSFIQLLEKRYKDKLDEDADDFIAFIVDGAKRMQTLINDLLLFSRIGRGDKPFKLIDINVVIDSVINNLKKSIEETNATITHDPLPTIIANEGEFIQLLQNLISNAIKFHKAEEPPVVHISAKLQKNQWIFSVRDNGIGLDSQYFGRIFIIFQRLHKKDEFGGTGIGLAICKKIIERHSGKIWVESELGKGSTFYFSIPKTEVKK